MSLLPLISAIEAGSTDLQSCLSTRPELSNDEKLELILADQRYRISNGLDGNADHYVEQFPWLADNRNVCNRLIVGEYQQRAFKNPQSDFLKQFVSQLADINDSLFDQLLRVHIERNLALGQSMHWETYHELFPVYHQTIDAIRKEHTDPATAFHGNPLPDASLPTRPASKPNRPNDLTGSFISSLAIGDLRGGRYRLERKLGQGAFGAVYLAQDTELQRQVAIKIPRPEALAKLGNIDTYLAEARNVASLDHPHIVSVFDVGRTADGSLYVVSKFIDGGSLAEWNKTASPDFRTIVDCLAKLAEALHHAHQKRLIHRDIKPANILIEEASGTPYLTDFGLSIREEDYLQDGHIAGTPAYMSPEQIRGEGHRLDGRSDLFSLGVVMYQILAGRMPFPGQTYEEIAHEITTVEPPAPRALRSDIPSELQRICLKLLRKRASERYPNGRDLAEDLRSWLTSRTAQATEKASQRITPRGLRSFTADDAGYFLDLLPGPRNRDGLPESIAFWKTKIEQRDPDQTFTVGLLYGPSGCGKSSMVKAGLVPNLSPEIIAIYVEATPDETESRLLRQLRKRIPDLPTELGLAETAEQVRRSIGPKVVLIIDQFEQWLYSHRVELDGELVIALRQCDGGRLQAILMIRDDFYLAAARLMNHIDVPIVTDQNFKLVDLFDTEHAKRVLVRFGEAYERLPMHTSARTPEHNAFVDQVVEGLSEGGKVVSVRLSLLADMLKGRDWTQSTLDTIGGLEGIGIHFLEETFATNRADARHRSHQVAVRGVLRALLPDSGTDIKGSMRSEEELLLASGYTNRRPDFQDLLRILDGELRLLTPTDPEGHDSQSGSDVPPRRYYQLTHDYLVPSLREWLTRKQLETKKGRAELKLAERAAAWNLNPESKQLPTFVEWFQIRRLTESAKWKPNEKSVMRQATRHYVQRMTLVTAAVVLLACGGWFAWGEASRRQEATRIAGLVDALINADPTLIPEIVKQLNTNHQVAASFLEPYLNNGAATPAEQRARLHARLAVVSRDSKLVDPLVEELLTGKLNYVLPIRQILKPSAGKLSESLQSLLLDDKADPQRRFRAALALADYVPLSDEVTWNDSNRTFIVKQLVSSNGELQPILREALRPIRRKLLDELMRIFGEEGAVDAKKRDTHYGFNGMLLSDLERIFGDSAASEAQRLSAANALADYAANDRARLTQLLTLATPEQYAVLYPLVSSIPLPETIAQLSDVAATPPRDDLGWVPRIAHGQRRANAAVTMLKLGEKVKVLPVFDWTDDPEAMTQFIFRCKPRGISIDTLLDLLDFTIRETSDASPGFRPARLICNARYALLLTIGEYASSEIPLARRESLIKQLADWYAGDPSSGIHGASGWLLRHLGEKEIADRVDQTPVPYSPDREWFTLAITVKPTPPPQPKPEKQEEFESSETKAEESHTEKSGAPPEPLPSKTFYYTFIVHPSGEYKIRSFEGQAWRDGAWDESVHTVTLKRPFAILDREITFEEFVAFSPLHGIFMRNNRASLDDAAFEVSWYESVEFCRWLGREMGLSEIDQCYSDPQSLDKFHYSLEEIDNSLLNISSFPKDWPLDLSKRGFRLPTESEWELIARGGTGTSFGYGSDIALLDRFGWFDENSGRKVHRGREKRPNVHGLFDLHGNLFEWTHDWYDHRRMGGRTDPLGADTGSERVYLGGGWDHGAYFCEFTQRNSIWPSHRNVNRGFRLALVPSGPAGLSSAEPGVVDGTGAEGDRRREE